MIERYYKQQPRPSPRERYVNAKLRRMPPKSQMNNAKRPVALMPVDTIVSLSVLYSSRPPSEDKAMSLRGDDDSIRQPSGQSKAIEAMIILLAHVGRVGHFSLWFVVVVLKIPRVGRAGHVRSDRCFQLPVVHLLPINVLEPCMILDIGRTASEIA